MSELKIFLVLGPALFSRRVEIYPFRIWAKTPDSKLLQIILEINPVQLKLNLVRSWMQIYLCTWYLRPHPLKKSSCVFFRINAIPWLASASSSHLSSLHPLALFPKGSRRNETVSLVQEMISYKMIFQSFLILWILFSTFLFSSRTFRQVRLSLSFFSIPVLATSFWLGNFFWLTVDVLVSRCKKFCQMTLNQFVLHWGREKKRFLGNIWVKNLVKIWESFWKGREMKEIWMKFAKVMQSITAFKCVFGIWRREFQIW